MRARASVTPPTLACAQANNAEALSVSGHAGPDHIYEFTASTTDMIDVRVSTCGSQFDTHVNLYHDINEMGTTCDTITNYQENWYSEVAFCNEYGMRSIESHDDTGKERCYYNTDLEHEDWWTYHDYATDFSFTAPAGKTFWISVTGAARDAGGRARARAVRFY